MSTISFILVVLVALVVGMASVLWPVPSWDSSWAT